jgi:hypothetical protein
MTPITMGAAAEVLPAALAEAEPAGDEGEADEEDEELLHPARASAARAIAGNPARAPVRRDRVIAALPMLAPDLAGADRGAGDRGI